MPTLQINLIQLYLQRRVLSELLKASSLRKCRGHQEWPGPCKGLNPKSSPHQQQQQPTPPHVPYGGVPAKYQKLKKAAVGCADIRCCMSSPPPSSVSANFGSSAAPQPAAALQQKPGQSTLLGSAQDCPIVLESDSDDEGGGGAAAAAAASASQQHPPQANCSASPAAVTTAAPGGGSPPRQPAAPGSQPQSRPLPGGCQPLCRTKQQRSPAAGPGAAIPQVLPAANYLRAMAWKQTLRTAVVRTTVPGARLQNPFKTLLSMEVIDSCSLQALPGSIEVPFHCGRANDPMHIPHSPAAAALLRWDVPAAATGGGLWRFEEREVHFVVAGQQHTVVIEVTGVLYV